MAKRRTIPLVHSLALAVAEGRSIAEWCRETGTPERTAYTWSKLDDFTSMVAEIQAQTLATAVRKLAAGTTKAAEVLIKLMDSADEKIKLQAARAVLGDYSAFDTYIDVRARLEALEGRANREPHRRKA